MLPEFLQSSYARYKDDTDRFATWLHNAAEQCGYSAKLPASNHSRGKTSAADQRYLATTEELRAYSHVIAESAYEVPHSILAAARRAIALRKDVSKWYLGRSEPLLHASHAHFISVMEEIYETLDSRCPKQNVSQRPDKEKQAVDRTSGADDCFNKFAALKVEEPREPLSGPAKVGQAPKVELAEAHDDNEQHDFNLYSCLPLLCLFKDLHHMRQFISRMWNDYRHGKADLMATTIVTDTALQLARDLVQDVLKTLPFESPESMIQDALYAASGFEYSPLYIGSNCALPYGEKQSNMASWLYLPTRGFLTTFAGSFQEGVVPVYRGQHGVYDPNVCRAQMSTAEQTNEDRIILLELMCDLWLLSVVPDPLPVCDEITRGVIEFLKTKEVTLWVSFAVQILLDVHHTMRGARINALADLRLTGLRLKRTLKDFEASRVTSRRPDLWPADGDAKILRILSLVSGMIEDDPLLRVRRINPQVFPPSRLDADKHKLMKQHPTFCGAIMVHLNLRAQEIGQILCSVCDEVQGMAYVYNIVNQRASMNLQWPDMEALIAIHGESYIFVGSRPDTARDSLIRLQKVTGRASIASFRNRQRLPHQRKYRAQSRPFLPTTKAYNLFRERYGVGSHDSRSVGLSNLSQLLVAFSQIPRETTSSDESTLLPTTSRLVHRTVQEHSSAEADTLFSALQLLAVLKSHLRAEEPVLLFSYFELHARVREMVRLIREREYNECIQYGTEADTADWAVPSIALCAITNADNAKVESRMIKTCGEVLTKCIKEKGDSVCKAVKAFSRNKSPIAAPGENRTEESDQDFAYWFALEQMADEMEEAPTLQQSDYSAPTIWVSPTKSDQAPAIGGKPPSNRSALGFGVSLTSRWRLFSVLIGLIIVAWYRLNYS